MNKTPSRAVALALSLLLPCGGPGFAAAASIVSGSALAATGAGFHADVSRVSAGAPMALSLGGLPSLTAAPGALSLPVAAPLASAPSLAVLSAAPALAVPAAAGGAAQAPVQTDVPASKDDAKQPSALTVARQAGAKGVASEAVSGQVFDGGVAPAAGAELVPIRAQIRQPGVYLLSRDGKAKDDSVGRKLTSSLDAADIRAALRGLGADALKGQKLYITGVEMGSGKKTGESVSALLTELGLTSDQVRVSVLTIPRAWKAGFLRALWDRVVYFLPSKTRDFQAPLSGEIIAGALTTLVLELPNAIYLLSAMVRPDAWIVLGIHTALLAIYTIFQRTNTNWILRSGKAGILAKSGLMSLPFILNYNVFGHFSAIKAFWQSAGIAGVLHALPSQLLGFGVTQGLTTVLQTIFYSVVVTGGFRAWAGKQGTPENAQAARSWVNVLLVPFLWLDSIFLTQASTASTVFLHWGAFLLTGGHLALVALTIGGLFAAKRTKILDATLSWYKKVAAWFKRFRRAKPAAAAEAPAAYETRTSGSVRELWSAGKRVGVITTLPASTRLYHWTSKETADRIAAAGKLSDSDRKYYSEESKGSYGHGLYVSLNDRDSSRFGTDLLAISPSRELNILTFDGGSVPYGAREAAMQDALRGQRVDGFMMADTWIDLIDLSAVGPIARGAVAP